MKRFYSACGLFGALLLVSGCGSSKPEVPSWFKGDAKKDKGGDLVVVGKNSPEALQRDLTAKIKQLEKKMAALNEAIESIDKSKSAIKEQLRKLGVRNSDDLKKDAFKNDEDVQRLANSLIKKSHEHAKYQQMQKQYGVALFDGKEALDSLDRQLKLAKAGITEKELEDLIVTIRKIDERLIATEAANPVDAIKGDSVLEKELKSGN